MSTEYERRLQEEQLRFNKDLDVHDLPEIFHYWSNRYLRPILEEIGVSNPDQFFAKYLALSGQRCGDQNPKFVSLGAGNCDTEIRVAEALLQQGLKNFELHCVDFSTDMLARGRELATQRGLDDHIHTIAADLNDWVPESKYSGIMANQSLHHMVELERVFGMVDEILPESGLFVVSDMIGRNGHQRWPEALHIVQNLWKDLPESYRYNLQLRRDESEYLDWDCSVEGFEGIRSQDILPLLVEKFEFEVFVGFSNIICPFIDRSFGHHFNANAAWDREFIDKVHALDEAAIRDGTLTPTQMMGVLSKSKSQSPYFSMGRSPQESIRVPTPQEIRRNHWRNRLGVPASAVRKWLINVVTSHFPWLAERLKRSRR